MTFLSITQAYAHDNMELKLTHDSCTRFNRIYK